MAVVIKKAEKARLILEKMSDINNSEEFAEIFKSLYPIDYQKIEKKYRIEEQKDKKKKGHPMPDPKIYLKNMYKVALKKNNE